MILSHLFDLLEKSLFWEILKYFSTKYLYLGTCFDSWAEISILVQKTATRAWIHSSEFLPNIKLAVNLLKLQPKQNSFIILNCYHIHFILAWKKFSILKTSPMSCYSIFAENVLEWIHTLVAVILKCFLMNQSKYLIEDIWWKQFSKFLLSYVSCWVGP